MLGGMKQQEISAELWERIRPLLPAPKPASPRGGRPRIDDQLALNGIVYVLRTGIPWEELSRRRWAGAVA